MYTRVDISVFRVYEWCRDTVLASSGTDQRPLGIRTKIQYCFRVCRRPNRYKRCGRNPWLAYWFAHRYLIGLSNHGGLSAITEYKDVELKTKNREWVSITHLKKTTHCVYINPTQRQKWQQRLLGSICCLSEPLKKHTTSAWRAHEEGRGGQASRRGLDGVGGAQGKGQSNVPFVHASCSAALS